MKRINSLIKKWKDIRSQTPKQNNARWNEANGIVIGLCLARMCINEKNNKQMQTEAEYRICNHCGMTIGSNPAGSCPVYCIPQTIINAKHKGVTK